MSTRRACVFLGVGGRPCPSRDVPWNSPAGPSLRLTRGLLTAHLGLAARGQRGCSCLLPGRRHRASWQELLAQHTHAAQCGGGLSLL